LTSGGLGIGSNVGGSDLAASLPPWQRSSKTQKVTLTEWSMPNKGEQVQLINVRRRPWLNGMFGEVVSSRPDELGFLTVRLPTADPEAMPSRAFKKVHPSRLQPLAGLGTSKSAPVFAPHAQPPSSPFGPAGNRLRSVLTACDPFDDDVMSLSRTSTSSWPSASPSRRLALGDRAATAPVARATLQSQRQKGMSNPHVSLNTLLAMGCQNNPQHAGDAV